MKEEDGYEALNELQNDSLLQILILFDWLLRQLGICMYFTFACSMIFVPASIRTFSFASESFQKPSRTSFGTSCADAAVTIVISAKEMDFNLISI